MGPTAPHQRSDPICVLETENAAQEINAPASGTLKHKVAAGDIYPVGTDIGEIV